MHYFFLRYGEALYLLIYKSVQFLFIEFHALSNFIHFFFLFFALLMIPKKKTKNRSLFSRHFSYSFKKKRVKYSFDSSQYG